MSKPDYENAIKFDGSTGSIDNIGSIYITGGGFINREFKSISPESSYGWNELVWKKTPTRTSDFSFKNIDNIKVGLVSRCEVNIKYMNIKDYMDLRHILTYSKRFKVRFFNRDEGDWVTKDMYCSEQSLSKLYTLHKSLIGVIDLAIKFVGTNIGEVPQDTYTIQYNANGGSGSISSITDIAYGASATLSDGTGMSYSGKTLQKWSTNSDGSGYSYLASQSVTVFGNMTLYAIWG